jgi:hypothetical protein
VLDEKPPKAEKRALVQQQLDAGKIGHARAQFLFEDIDRQEGEE